MLKLMTHAAKAEEVLKIETVPIDKLPNFLPRAIERYKALIHDLGETLQRDVAHKLANISKRLLVRLNYCQSQKGTSWLNCSTVMRGW